VTGQTVEDSLIEGFGAPVSSTSVPLEATAGLQDGKTFAGAWQT